MTDKKIYMKAANITEFVRNVLNEDLIEYSKKVIFDFKNNINYQKENFLYEKFSKSIKSFPQYAPEIAEICQPRASTSYKAFECLIKCYCTNPKKVTPFLHMVLNDFEYKLKHNNIDNISEYHIFCFGFLYAFNIGNYKKRELSITCFNNSNSIIESLMFKILTNATILEYRFSSSEKYKLLCDLEKLKKKLKKNNPIIYKNYIKSLYKDIIYYTENKTFDDNLNHKYDNIFLSNEKLSLGTLFETYYAAKSIE
ncbi:MAG: hypothetical protein HFE59_09950 [Clostridiales bacterium]|nr:hypothetical protein [Clostridiales bacterium]